MALLRRMSGRDPDEEHRSSTPLELLFDLTFVIAVAQAGTQLRHALAVGQATPWHPEHITERNPSRPPSA
jgi:low temperature requirement protein LtrA